MAFERLENTAQLLKSHILEGTFVDEQARSLVDLAGGLGWEKPPPQDAPPATGHLLAEGVLPLTHHGLARAALCRMSEPHWWLMMHHDEKGATLCELGLPDPTARCHGVPTAIPTGGDLYLVDGGLAPMPRLLAGREGDWGLYAPAGKRVAVLPAGTLGATALPTGDAAALVAAEEGYAVFVDGVSRFSLTASAPPLLYGGYVIAQSGRDFSAYAIDSGERVVLGTLASPARTTMRGCVASAVTAVRVRDHERKGDVLIAQRAGAWSLWPLPKGVPPFSLSCHGDSAHLTWIETLEAVASDDGAVRGTYRAHDVVCSPEGCRERSGDLSLRRHAVRSRFFIASLGEDLAVIWRTPHGDVRARIAPPAELASRASVPILEDEAHLGFAWDEAEMRLLSAERAAIFLIEKDGVHGIVLDGNGARALTPPPR